MYKTNHARLEYFFNECKEYIAKGNIGNKYILNADKKNSFSENCEILYYKSTGPSENKRIFLIVPSIFNSPEILFLNKEINFVDYLKHNGDVYLLNWLEIESKEFSLDDYVKELLKVITFIGNKRGQEINLIGHCIGGNITLAASVIQPSLIKNITLLTVPWDFSHFNLIRNLHKQLDLDFYVQSLPYIPKIYIKILFFLLFPDYFNIKIEKYFNFTSNRDKQLFIEVEHWLMSGNSLPHATYFQITNQMMTNNILLKNEWKIDQIVINPKYLDKSVFILIARNDQLVPYSSVLPLYNSFSNSKIIEVEGGHISYLIGPNIHNFFRPYQSWLQGDI